MQIDSKRDARVKRLDAARGIAAMMVVVGHSVGSVAVAIQSPVISWPFALLWDGESAVIFFFLLSGYVLTIRFVSGTPPTYWEFAVRRVLRLWPPFAVSLIFAAVVYALLPRDWPGDLGSNLNLAGVFRNWRTFVANAVMAGDPKSFNPPAWSLFVEMRMSLLFPFLLSIFVFRFKPSVALPLCLAASLIISRLDYAAAPTILHEVGHTARWLHLFILGAIALRYRDRLKDGYDTMPSSMKVALGIAAISLLSYHFGPASLPLKNPLREIGVLLVFYFVLCADVLERPLTRPLPLMLGRLSYSVYLLHWPILVGAVKLWPPQLPHIGIVLLVPIVTIGAAEVLYRFVELPAIRLGKRLSANIAAAKPHHMAG